MKRWILHIMLVGMLGMLAASCSQDADNPTHGEEGRKVQVTFTLATGGQGAYSRTTWEGYDGDGTGDVTPVYGGEAFDNKIDPDQLQVWICKADCTPLAKVERLLHTKESDNTYKFTGTFEADINEDNNYKVMVFANCPEITTLPTSITATSMMKEMPANGNIDAIPMWGVQQISGADLLGEIQGIKIYVLRALAKVEIALSADMISAGEYTLQSASFTKYNKNINCIPNGFANVAATTELGTATANATSGTTTTYAGFNPNTSGNTSDGGTLSFITITAGQKLVAYVPEYDNDGTLAMTVNVLKSGESTPTAYEVPFKYSETAVEDVIRNYYYTYSITAVKTGFDLKLTVVPWTDVTETFNYEDNLSYAAGSWDNATVATDTNGRKIVSLITATTADATTDVTAVYNFNINTPQTIEWMAVLEDPDGKFQFDMSRTSGKGTVEGDNAIQRTVRGELLVTGSNLKLGVKAIDPSESGQYEAILRVYVTYGGKTIELDLTDGEQTALNHFTIQHSKL